MNVTFFPKKTELTPSQNNSMKISPSKNFTEGAFNPMPAGENDGDLMYWDPNAGDSGAWVIVSAPDPNEEDPKFLKFGSNLFWGDSDGLPNGSNLGDLLYWNPSAGNGGAWVVLSAPSGNSLRVLTIQNNNLAWTDTQDC